MVKEVKNTKEIKKTAATKKTAAKSVSSVKKAVKAKSNPVNNAIAKKEGRLKSASALRQAEANPDYTDAFIQEVSEDVKNDNFKELWKRYGVWVVALVVVAVTAAVSFERIKSWKQEQMQYRTESYMKAAQRQPDLENTLAALRRIEEKDSGIFGDFAKLQIANVLFEQGKTDDGLAALKALMDEDEVNSEVKKIALIKYATYQVDVMPYEEFFDLLKPISQESSSWTPLADDLLAMSAIRAGNIETAKQIYTNLLRVKDLPDNFRTKIQDMLSSISDM